jgi:hypothetical protein
MMKIAGSGSIRQRHGSADPDPDPLQNVMDPEHSGRVEVTPFPEDLRYQRNRIQTAEATCNGTIRKIFSLRGLKR